jgi:hypothetical protein
MPLAALLPCPASVRFHVDNLKAYESCYDGSSAGTESNPQSLSNAVINPDPELINKWCVIKCDGQLYPGIIQDIDSDSVEVKCMHRE